MTPWRNGSASDSRSEGCVFKSRRGQGLLGDDHCSMCQICQASSFLIICHLTKTLREQSCVTNCISKGHFVPVELSNIDVQHPPFYFLEELFSCLKTYTTSMFGSTDNQAQCGSSLEKLLLTARSNQCKNHIECHIKPIQLLLL